MLFGVFTRAMPAAVAMVAALTITRGRQTDRSEAYQVLIVTCPRVRRLVFRRL